MSLRKSPTLTPARIEASRRNAQKSTGPRTARGKSQSRMNGLRTGSRSALRRDLFMRLFDAPPYGIDKVAHAILTPEQAVHPMFSRIVDEFRCAEIEVVLEQRRILDRCDARKSTGGFDGAFSNGPAVAERARNRDQPGSAEKPAKRFISKRRAKLECY